MKDDFISLVFYRNNSILSKLIRLFTYSETSHVAICVERWGTKLLYQGTTRGVVFDTKESYELKTGNTEVAEYQIKVPVEHGMKYLLSLLGSKYDFAGAAGVGIVKVFKKWFGKKIKNPFASPKSMICSELVVELNHYGEIMSFDPLDPERTSPGDLLEICRKDCYNEFEIVE